MQIKDKLHQQNLERKYGGYQLEGDDILTYKNRIYIPNVVDLRMIVMDESIKIHILVTQDIRKQLLHPEISIFG